MHSPSHRVIKTGGGVDLAFAVVILASYFATFSSIRAATNLQIFLLVGFGIAYVAIGIYGYKFCARSSNLFLQIAYFAVQIPIGSAIIYLSKGGGFNALILLPLAGHSVVMLPTLWLYGVNTVLVIAYTVSVASFSTGWEVVWSSLPTFLAGVIFIMVFTQMAVGEERARLEVERLLKDLAEANSRLRMYALQVEELAITRERNRLAREIHDGLGHYLTTIHMQIQAISALIKVDPNRAQAAVEKAQTLTQEALLDVRRSVAALHSLPEESLPLNESLTKVLENCRAAGLDPDLTILGNPRTLPPEAQLTIFRTAQESVNNTCKHAHASKIFFTLDYTREGMVSLKVADDGVGSENPTGGFGLLGLQERAHLLNGEFSIHSAPGQGFALVITVPG